MSASHFKNLVEKGNPVGEVIAVERFLVRVSGLQPVSINALVMFEDGSKGTVYQVLEHSVLILHLGTRTLHTGIAVVLQYNQLVTKVGKDFIGRVVSVFGEPLDGKGPIAPDGVWPVFRPAPPLISRQQLDTQFETGLTIIDALFPLSYGQRIAILGDSKAGKTTMATQVAINQRGTEKITIYALIGKRRADVNMLLNRLTENQAMDNTIVIVSTMFDSLIATYLAPYVAVSIAEYLWQSCNLDCLIVYDDLTSHAYAYREISLLANVSPGRDSFPGDMFYAHSSLLERAGRIKSSGKTLTSLPMVLAPGGDITAYLPTNIMSITDGQLILDMDIFRDGIRPAVSTGLSVSRVGGVGHNSRQKSQGVRVMRALSAYREAEEFSHFGAEMGAQAKTDLELGKLINEVISQAPGEYFSVMAQQLMLEIVLSNAGKAVIDVRAMKQRANDIAQTVQTDEQFDAALAQLLAICVIENKAKPAPEAKPAAAQPAEGDKQASDAKPEDAKKDKAADAPAEPAEEPAKPTEDETKPPTEEKTVEAAPASTDEPASTPEPANDDTPAETEQPVAEQDVPAQEESKADEEAKQ